MNKLDIKINDAVIEDDLRSHGLKPMKAFYNPVNWDSNIHMIFEGDERELTDVISWFSQIAIEHDVSIVYYDLKLFEKRNYYIDKEDILNFTLESNLEIDEDVLTRFMDVIDEHNYIISKKEEGVIDTYILYFLYEGKVFSYFMKNEDLISVDEILDDFVDNIGETMSTEPTMFIN